jgi:ABC-type antimicrobial peptide transport system permease subunit
LLRPASGPDQIAGVKLNIISMITYAKVKFWSFLVIGVVCIFIGAYLFPYGPDKRSLAEFLLLIGGAQLIIFVVLLFFRYRKRNREAAQT